MSATTRWVLAAAVLAALLGASAAWAADGNIPFEKVVIDPKMAGDCKMVADLDGDGRLDLIIGGTKGSEDLVWYHGPKWTKTLISKAVTEFTTLGTVGDVDGDGDVDIIVPDGSGQDNLLWIENPKPKGDPFKADQWKRHVIGTVGDWGKDVYVNDLDGDGRLDVVAHGRSTVMIFFHDGPDLWKKVELKGFQTGDEGLGAGDVNGDGLVDLISRGVWVENPGKAAAREAARWKAHPIGEFHKDFKAVVADINGDGHKDVVTCSSEGVADLVWWEPAAGDPRGKWTPHVVGKALDRSHTLEVADMDGDGRLDIISGQMHTSNEKETTVWHNLDGKGLSWRKQVVDREGIHNGVVADIDGDGRLDIFAVNWTGHPPARVFFNRGSAKAPGAATSRASGGTEPKPVPAGGPASRPPLTLDKWTYRVPWLAERSGATTQWVPLLWVPWLAERSGATTLWAGLLWSSGGLTCTGAGGILTCASWDSRRTRGTP